MADDRPIQHTPKHLEGDVFDRRHPAASSFAPLQPAAGVVADDVEERGQNLRGGPKASDAHAANLDQTQKLLDQHAASLRAPVAAAPSAPSAPSAPAAKVEGDKATPVKSTSTAAKSR